MSDHNPTMFCHDGTSIYYPTAPGRVYIIGIAALADCDGSDEDYSDSTSLGDLSDLMSAGNASGCSLRHVSMAPDEWPCNEVETIEEVNQDFVDCIEQWADWCDCDSERIDAIDSLAPAIAEMSLAEAVSCSQPAVAI